MMTASICGLVIFLVTVSYASGYDGSMEISEFVVESELVPLGGDIVFRCRVSDMDLAKFVRYTKLVPGKASSTDVKLTTNVVKEDSIKSLDRYTINATQNNVNGYDFVLRITDARVEDSGRYLCTIPVISKAAHVQVNVVVHPTSIDFLVDGRPVFGSQQRIEFSNVTELNLTCTVSGGNPQPVVDITSGAIELPVSGNESFCTVNPSNPPFMSAVSCTTTVSVHRYRVGYQTSGLPVTCLARSRGSSDVRLSVSFTPVLPGGLPDMRCDNSIIARVYRPKVRLTCRIISSPPLVDAHIRWSPGGLLRPAFRPGWPDGVRFDRDDQYLAYRRQDANSTILELEFDRVFPQMFRDYHFVATNDFGSSEHVIQLVEDPTHDEVRSGGFLNASGQLLAIICLTLNWFAVQ